MKKKNFSNLYTSFERVENGHLLTAYFGVDVYSLMKENLKFPNLFVVEEFLEYVVSIKIIPKIRSLPTFRSTYFPSSLRYVSEKTHIEPDIVSLAGTNGRFVYFTFRQLFKSDVPEERKYEFVLSVEDKSVLRAAELQKSARQLIRQMDSFSEIEMLASEVPELIRVCGALHGIRGMYRKVYDDVRKRNYLITNRTYSMIEKEILADLKFIDGGIEHNAKDGLRTASINADSRTTPVAIEVRNEFGHLPAPKTNESLSSDLDIRSGFTSDSPDRTLYTTTMVIPTIIVDELPTFEDKYRRSDSFKEGSLLKNKAPNLNLDFACLDAPTDDKSASSLTCIESQNFDDVYILVNHAHNSVSSPEFMPLVEARQNLLNNSNYLCKTHHIDAENQYFILET